MGFILREAWTEFRFGMKSGVVPLIYVVLAGYLLMVLANADYLRDMGAVDVPRNAPSLVYLMTSGDSFFLFFAWAWVFAQPVARDRAALLHEVVLAAPVSLPRLLAARYLGALGVALVLGSSQIVGFLAAPVLEWIGAVPAGSVAAPPWLAFGWATLVFTLPLAAGAGALYFVAALRTRGPAGPFMVAAALMACWMVSMIVLKDGHIDQFYSTVLDPSGFAETEYQVVDHWTPQQKRTALVALGPALLLNRAIWGLLPVLLLAWVLARATREGLVLERAPRAGRRAGAAHSAAASAAPPARLPGPVARPAWGRALLAEAAWQTRRVTHRRWFWVALALLSLLAVAGAFVHGVQHAHGPLVPRPELIAPMLTKMFYLIVAFAVAALVGLAARRDEQPGLQEMFDAAPAPDAVRLAGRAAAALAATVLLCLIPAFGAILTAALAAPRSAGLVLPVAYEIAVLVPAMLELAAVTLLLHALIRRPGPAYAASMLAAFVMIVNHEAELVSYPPHQIGLGVRIAVSGLTGLAPWAGKLLASDGFKLCVVLLLLAAAALATRRGSDEGWRTRLRQGGARIAGPAGLTALAAVAGLAGTSALLHQRYVVDGNYETAAQRLAEDAAWEQRWLPRQAAFDVAGGSVELEVHPAERAVDGVWRLEGMRAANAELHAALPEGFALRYARVDGRDAPAAAGEEHLAIPLGACAASGCAVELAWTVRVVGWDADRRPPWLLADAYWLRAADLMPRLGFDGDRVPRTPSERAAEGLPAEMALPAYRASLASGAAAPAGHWRWRIRIHGVAHVREGASDGLLDFADVWAPAAERTEAAGVSVIHDASRRADAAAVATDLAEMRACVARRLGAAPAVAAVAQWPRGLGASDVAGGWLLLAEDPHWDVAEQGVGRAVRRAEIAAALARRQVRDAADLRDGAGALWLDAGLPGALGLLCVAEADGAAALEALLERGADRVTQALAVSPVPVGPLAAALTDGWAADYAPLAALAWTARQTPASAAALLAAVRADADVAGPLAAAAGIEQAALFLGPPNAVDLRRQGDAVAGERWQWRNGGWQAADSAPVPWRVLAAVPDAPLLDDWPAYEREPGDNAGRRPGAP